MSGARIDDRSIKIAVAVCIFVFGYLFGHYTSDTLAYIGVRQTLAGIKLPAPCQKMLMKEIDKAELRSGSGGGVINVAPAIGVIPVR